MSAGGVDDHHPPFSAPPDHRGPPTEAEEIHHRLKDGETVADGEDDTDLEGMKVRKGQETSGEVLLEKSSAGK